MTTHLIRNACVLTVNAGMEVFDPGFVLVEGDRIRAAGPMGQAPDGPFDRVTDAGGALLAPGLINLHQHVQMNFSKGLAGGLRLEKWSVGLAAKTRDAMVWEDFAASFRLGALEMLRTGTTTFFHHGASRYREGHEAEIAAEFRQFGIRQVLALPYQIRTPALPDHPFGPAEADAHLRARFRELDDRATDLVRIAAVIECNAHHTRAGRSSDELVQAGYATARDLDLRIGTHMSGGSLSLSFGFTYYKRLTGRSDVEYLRQMGVLDHRWLLIHGIHFTDQDMDMVAEAGSAVVYTPSSECSRGGGIGPWVEMLERGITCALGSDGPAVDYTVDMVEQMKAACLFQNLRHRRPGALAPARALRMATIDAARAIGMDDVIGSIESGKRADLVMFARDRAVQQLTDDPVAALVLATQGADAVLVMVNGEAVYDAGRFRAGIDPVAIMADAGARARRAGIDSGMVVRSVPDWPPVPALREREKWL